MQIQQQIEERLRETFAPLHLEVENESHMHNVPEGSESHFRVVLVTEQFDGKGLLQRHRAVNGALAEQLAFGSLLIEGLPVRLEDLVGLVELPIAVLELIVDGAPYVVLDGELHNSSASSIEYMKPIWEKLHAMHLNTVIGTVSSTLSPRIVPSGSSTSSRRWIAPTVEDAILP